MHDGGKTEKRTVRHARLVCKKGAHPPSKASAFCERRQGVLACTMGGKLNREPLDVLG